MPFELLEVDHILFHWKRTHSECFFILFFFLAQMLRTLAFNVGLKSDWMFWGKNRGKIIPAKVILADCRSFHFPLFLSQNISLFQHEPRALSICEHLCHIPTSRQASDVVIHTYTSMRWEGGGKEAHILSIVKMRYQFILSTESVHPVYSESLHKLDNLHTAWVGYPAYSLSRISCLQLE